MGLSTTRITGVAAVLLCTAGSTAEPPGDLGIPDPPTSPPPGIHHTDDPPLVAAAPHDRKPTAGHEGWKGAWDAPSFDNASVEREEGARPPFDAYVRTEYPEGMQDGRGPVNWHGWHEEGIDRELQHVRLRKWLRIGGEREDFESHPVGTKMGFFGAGACNGARNEIYPFLEGGLRERFSVRVVQQFLDRKNMTQNVIGDRVVRAGVWQEWEIEMRMNDPGSENGIFRLLVDGWLLIDHDDVKYRNDEHPCGFRMWRWNPTWGGSTGDVKARTDHIDIAEVKIWGTPL